MNKLFVRIFLWFWIGTVLVWTAFIIPSQRTQTNASRERINALTSQRLLLAGWVGLATYARRGPDGLQQMMEDVEQRSNLAYPYILDDDFQELAGREIPPEALEIAHRAAEIDELRMEFPASGDRPASLYYAKTIDDRSGRHYTVVQPLLPRLDTPPNVFASPIRWASVLLISGVVCWVLARYMVSPLTSLSDATRRLARGDLDVRVSASLGGRGDELGALGHDFDAMAVRIGTLLRTQRQLLSDISHELRSPLARLYVALGLARRHSNAEGQEALDRIERETERLNHLIGELLSLTRLEGGDLAREREAVNLADLVAEVANDADYEARARGRGVRLVSSEACVSMGFQELLRRALENVVRNAVRYTAEGTEVEVRLEVDRDNGFHEAVVSVRDRGPGVPEEALDDLFRPFYRTAEARERETGGTGLGLAISDRAVRLHGGQIGARNLQEGGLEVTLRIPTERPA